MIAKRLIDQNINLPKVSAPVANYLPVTQSGNIVYISGQLPFWEGEKKFLGKVGHTITTEQAQEAARLCGLNIIAQLDYHLKGNLDKVVRCLKIGGFDNAIPDFADHPTVLNGASNLMVEIFGEKGKHARFAMGAASLPFNVAVEVEAMFEVLD
ncbi:MAG: RidA family protein [Alphaproteobacteria bacterium]|nr:RidA family protein [Alphaproteobacteria bacterium]